jgi:glycosyltransferase involved in cell wall biosynthesis
VLYGVSNLEAFGYSVSSKARYKNRIAVKISALFEHRLGFPIQIPLRSIWQVSRAELVIALLEHNAILALKLKSLGVWPYKQKSIFILACWLTETLSRLSAVDRAKLVDLYSNAERIIVLSKNQIELLCEFGFAREKLVAIDFGVNLSFKCESRAARGIDVLAVGQDQGRDYQTLFEAVSGTGINLHLVCKPENVAHLKIPSEAKNIGRVSRFEYRNLLADAKIVVVPTLNFSYPTGQSVALEAALSCAAIVVSKTEAMSQYFEDSVTALMPDVRDASAMKTSITMLLQNELLRSRLVENSQSQIILRFTEPKMWAQFASYIEDVRD